MHPRCESCAHFVDDPQVIEAALPGLTILSSAYGSARGDAGLCEKHDLWLSARETCPDHVPSETDHT